MLLTFIDSCASDLRLQVAGFAAIPAVIRSVCAEPHVVDSLAQAAVLLAGAAGLLLIALGADELLRHTKNVARRQRCRKRDFQYSALRQA
jgi:hypothetical protein